MSKTKGTMKSANKTHQAFPDWEKCSEWEGTLQNNPRSPEGKRKIGSKVKSSTQLLSHTMAMLAEEISKEERHFAVIPLQHTAVGYRSFNKLPFHQGTMSRKPWITASWSFKRLFPTLLYLNQYLVQDSVELSSSPPHFVHHGTAERCVLMEHFERRLLY